MEIQDTRPQIARPRTLQHATAVVSRVIFRATVKTDAQMLAVPKVVEWAALTRPATAAALLVISHVIAQSTDAWMALNVTSVAVKVTSPVTARMPVQLEGSKADPEDFQAVLHRLERMAVAEALEIVRCSATRAEDMVTCLVTAPRELSAITVSLNH